MKKMFKTLNLALVVSFAAYTAGTLAMDPNVTNAESKWTKVQNFVKNHKKAVIGTAVAGTAAAGTGIAYYLTKTLGQTAETVATVANQVAKKAPAIVIAEPVVTQPNPIVNSKNVIIGVSVLGAVTLVAIVSAVVAWNNSWYSKGWNATKNGFALAKTKTGAALTYTKTKAGELFTSAKTKAFSALTWLLTSKKKVASPKVGDKKNIDGKSLELKKLAKDEKYKTLDDKKAEVELTADADKEDWVLA